MIKVLVISIVIDCTLRQFECSPEIRRLEVSTKDPDPLDDDSVNTPPPEDEIPAAGRSGPADSEKNGGNMKPYNKKKGRKSNNAPNSVVESFVQNHLKQSESYGGSSTTELPFPLETMDEDSHNKTIELIRLINNIKVIPHNGKDVKPPKLKHKSKTSQVEPVEVHSVKNERRYVISNFDVIDSYMKRRMEKDVNSEVKYAATKLPIRRRADYINRGLMAADDVYSRAVHNLILLKIPLFGIQTRAEDGEESEKADEFAAESPDLLERAKNFNYGDRSDDYIISTKPDVWNYEHEDWGATEKMNWDEHNNDSTVRGDFEEAIGKEHNKFAQNENDEKDKDVVKKEGHDWEDNDPLAKVETVLKGTGVTDKKGDSIHDTDKGNENNEFKYPNEERPQEANQNKNQIDEDRDTQPGADWKKTTEKEGRVGNPVRPKEPEWPKEPEKKETRERKRDNNNRVTSDTNMPSRPGNPKINELNPPNQQNPLTKHKRLDYLDEPEKSEMSQTERQRESKPRQRPGKSDNPDRPSHKRDESGYDYNPKKNAWNEMNKPDRPRERETGKRYTKYGSRYSKITKRYYSENQEFPPQTEEDHGQQQNKDLEERHKDIFDGDQRKGFNNDDASDKKTTDDSDSRKQKDKFGDDDLSSKRFLRRPENKRSNEREDRENYREKFEATDDYARNDEMPVKKDSRSRIRDEGSNRGLAQNLGSGPDSRERETENKRWKKDSMDDLKKPLVDDFKKPLREEGGRGRSDYKDRKGRDESDRFNDRNANNDWDKVGVNPARNKYTERGDYERPERGERMKNNWDSRGGAKNWDRSQEGRPRERKQYRGDGPDKRGFGHTLLSFMKNKSIYVK